VVDGLNHGGSVAGSLMHDAGTVFGNHWCSSAILIKSLGLSVLASTDTDIVLMLA
jgi:hypothetical protein